MHRQRMLRRTLYTSIPSYDFCGEYAHQVLGIIPVPQRVIINGALCRYNRVFMMSVANIGGNVHCTTPNAAGGMS